MAVSSLSEGVAESVGASLGALAALGARGPAFSGLWPSLLPARAGLLLALDSVSGPSAPGAALPRHFGTASGLRASGTARLPLTSGPEASSSRHFGAASGLRASGTARLPLTSGPEASSPRHFGAASGLRASGTAQLPLTTGPEASSPRHFGAASGTWASGTARLPLAVGVGRSLQPHWASSIAFLAALWASLSATSWSLAATRSRHAWVAASGWIRRSRSTMVGRPGSSETSRRAGKAEASAISLLVRGEGCSVAVVVVFTRSTALSDSKADFSIGLRPFVSA